MQIDFESAKKQICALVVDEMDFEREMTDFEIFEAIDNALMKFEGRESLSLTEELALRNEAYNSLRKYDVIQEYLDDEEVTEPCTLMKIPAKPRKNRAFQRLSNF